MDVAAGQRAQHPVPRTQHFASRTWSTEPRQRSDALPEAAVQWRYRPEGDIRPARKRTLKSISATNEP